MDARASFQLRKARYLSTVAGKALAARPLAMMSKAPADAPTVTVFITTKNNADALELTLRTLAATTRYPNYSILVADNGSADRPSKS